MSNVLKLAQIWQFQHKNFWRASGKFFLAPFAPQFYAGTTPGHKLQYKVQLHYYMTGYNMLTCFFAFAFYILHLEMCVYKRNKERI